LRIALFSLDSALAAPAIAAFLAATRHELVLHARSDPFRSGGALAQALRHWRRSGPRLLPFLAVNYALPQARARGPRLADVNGPAAAAMIRAARPDVLVSCHFDQIFTAETLALAPLGGVNLHPSLLPHHRGPVPTLWALAEEAPRFGVSIHRLVPRIDAGAILAQRAVPLPAGSTASAAARALHLAGVPLLEAALDALAAGAAEPPAPDPLPYCPFPPPALLRGLARRGRRLVDLADLRAALAGPD
jgi:hypothetical protein